MKKILLIISLLISVIINANELKKITQACESNNLNKCSELAHIYDSGTINVEKNPAKALELFTKACDGNNGEGCYYLSFKYHFGSSGVKKNNEKEKELLAKAEKIWKEGCDKGNIESCTWLGNFYSMTMDESNYPNAVKYYTKACDSDNAQGCTNLGHMNKEGYGVEQSYKKAVQLYKRSCSDSNALGCLWLGYMYINGSGIKSDYSMAGKMFKKACDNGNNDGCKNYTNNENDCDSLAADPKDRSNSTGVKGVEFSDIDFRAAIEQCTQAVKNFPNIARYKYQLGRAYTKGGGTLDGIEWFEKSAKQGHYLAQYYIAAIYDFKEELIDRKKAFKWYLKAAKQGHTPSQTKVAYAYSFTTEDYGVEKSDKKAFKWFLKAARGGFVFAQQSVAGMYIAGKGVERNYKKGLYWFKKAAVQGNLKSQLFVAGEYYLGKRIEKNYKKSLFWFKKAAEQGHIFSLNEVGFSYYLGRGTEKNYKESFKWYMKAAKQGHAESQNRIGKAYYYGMGTKKNYKKSFEWRIKAARQGNIFGQMSIGRMYLYGEGVKRNYIKAYAWINQALSGNMHMKLRPDYTTMLNTIEVKMTPQQISIAQDYDPMVEVKEEPNSKTKSVPSNIYTGTGFFVNQSAVVTNYHVVKECKNIEIVKGDQRFDAHVLIGDSRNDLAVLKTKKANNDFLHFRADRGIRIGEQIIVLGYPFGKLLGTGVKLTTGNISALTGLVDDVTSIQITAPVQPGNSGGPLLDSSGNLVGIVVARLEKDLSGNVAQNVNIAIKSNVLKMLLSTNGIDYSMSASKDKKEVADIADDAKESVVQVICYE